MGIGLSFDCQPGTPQVSNPGHFDFRPVSITAPIVASCIHENLFTMPARQLQLLHCANTNCHRQSAQWVGRRCPGIGCRGNAALPSGICADYYLEMAFHFPIRTGLSRSSPSSNFAADSGYHANIARHITRGSNPALRGSGWHAHPDRFALGIAGAVVATKSVPATVRFVLVDAGPGAFEAATQPARHH